MRTLAPALLRRGVSFVGGLRDRFSVLPHLRDNKAEKKKKKKEKEKKKEKKKKKEERKEKKEREKNKEAEVKGDNETGSREHCRRRCAYSGHENAHGANPLPDHRYLYTRALDEKSELRRDNVSPPPPPLPRALPKKEASISTPRPPIPPRALPKKEASIATPRPPPPPRALSKKEAPIARPPPLPWALLKKEAPIATPRPPPTPPPPLKKIQRTWPSWSRAAPRAPHLGSYLDKLDNHPQRRQRRRSSASTASTVPITIETAAKSGNVGNSSPSRRKRLGDRRSARNVDSRGRQPSTLTKSVRRAGSLGRALITHWDEELRRALKQFSEDEIRPDHPHEKKKQQPSTRGERRYHDEKTGGDRNNDRRNADGERRRPRRDQRRPSLTSSVISLKQFVEEELRRDRPPKKKKEQPSTKKKEQPSTRGERRYRNDKTGGDRNNDRCKTRGERQYQSEGERRRPRRDQRRQEIFCGTVEKTEKGKGDLTPSSTTAGISSAKSGNINRSVNPSSVSQRKKSIDRGSARDVDCGPVTGVDRRYNKTLTATGSSRHADASVLSPSDNRKKDDSLGDDQKEGGMLGPALMTSLKQLVEEERRPDPPEMKKKQPSTRGERQYQSEGERRRPRRNQRRQEIICCSVEKTEMGKRDLILSSTGAGISSAKSGNVNRSINPSSVKYRGKRNLIRMSTIYNPPSPMQSPTSSLVSLDKFVDCVC